MPLSTMKIPHLSSILKITALLFFFGCIPPTGSLAQSSKTVSHEVQAGETLYQIAKRYGTTVKEIVSANKGLQADSVKAGKSIVVPVPSPVAATEGNTHTVKRKDTAYGIAKTYGISVEELYEANPQLKGNDYKLKKGMTLRIPQKEAPQAVTISKQSLRVCLLLPFQGNDIENTRSVEFYRGFLMGVEQLKEQNLNVEVHAFQEPAQDLGVASVMQRVEALHPDLIVGPVYPSHFGDVATAASSSCKVAIPFSSKVPQVEYHPHLFVVNTPQSFERTLCTSLFSESFGKEYKIILLRDIHGKRRELAEALRAKMAEKKCEIKTFDAKTSAADILHSLGKSAKGKYLVVPELSDEKSLRELLVKLRDLRSLSPQAQFSLIGYEEWLPLAASTLKNELHAADTYILTPSYFYPYTSASITFRENYRKWFKTDLLSTGTFSMAPLGYDLCIGLLGGIATYGQYFGTQTALPASLAALPKLQSDLRFMKASKDGGYVSRSYWLVHFKSDMSIVKLSAK